MVYTVKIVFYSSSMDDGEFTNCREIAVLFKHYTD